MKGRTAAVISILLGIVAVAAVNVQFGQMDPSASGEARTAGRAAASPAPRGPVAAPVDVPSRLPAGHAVISIPIGVASSADARVAVGDVVDVYLVRTTSSPKVPGGVEVISSRVAEDVTVWGVDGTNTRAGGAAPASVSVSAPPDAIERLLAARLQGRLSLQRKPKRGS